MYVTRLLSRCLRSPEYLSLPPEGPNSGYLVLQDEESETTTCFGLCKKRSLSDLPFPQNKDLTIRYSSGSGDNRNVSHYDIALIPVLNQPLSSNRYYAMKPHGSHKGEAYACSTENNMSTCCFCKCIKDVKPMPFDPNDIYQQFDIGPYEGACNAGGLFTATSIAPDGFPPYFMRRKGWEIYTGTPKNYKLGEALGVNNGLRSRLPDFNFPPHHKTSGAIVVGKWYCPFMFIRDGNLKDQMKRSMFYEMTLEQRWEQIFACENDSSQGNAVTVDATVQIETAFIEGKEATWDGSNEANGVVWFRSFGAGGETSVGLRPLEWKFSQVFGERTAGEEVQEVDIISAIEFDNTGDHLATGDRGGRVVLFERTDTKDQGGSHKDLERMDYPIHRHPEFRYKTEFQSHEPEFDYLKSLEIEEKINKIRWCQTANSALFLLSTNDKSIKFWKVQEKKVKKISEMNTDTSKAVGNGGMAGSSFSSNPKPFVANGGYPGRSYSYLSNDFSFPPGGIPSLRLPVVSSNETSLVARCRRVYAHAHDYHINSISNNSDGETFISADDLRINLWNLEISNQSFNIVDVKPANMEDLTEVITSAEFHPSHCNMLAYSSSKGSIRLIDLRQSALCDTHSKLFEEQEASGSRSFFTEIIASISDIKFGRDGRYLLSRDYMTLKVWDINMDSGPVATFQVHEYLRPKLCDLYENDSIFDKFECCLSGDGQRVATGSYSNLFRVFGCASGSAESSTLEASKNPTRRQVQTPSRPSRSLGSITRSVRRGAESLGVDANGNSFDFTTKLLHLAWHPTENSIACAAANSLYMYYA